MPSLPQENSKTQKQALCEKFDRLSTILEERRKIMMQHITYEQDDKTNHTQSLVHTYREQVGSNSKLVDTVLHTMEEPEMAAFVQVKLARLVPPITSVQYCTAYSTSSSQGTLGDWAVVA